MPTPVVVVVASHNSERFVRRTLASFDAALVDRPYALVWVDDASTDNTVQRVRQHVCQARERVTLKLPRAGSISASKNRALAVARPLLNRYPWVAFMDDDDEMLPGRFTTLLDRMEAEGQTAGVGDWICTPQSHPGELVTLKGDYSIARKEHAPGTTMVHRSLIPKDAKYFLEVPKDAVEDMVTHRSMELNGVPWAYHGGSPVHNYHNRYDSYLGIGPQARGYIEGARRVMATFPTTRTSIKSFCTLAFGKNGIAEARLLLRSLRAAGNQQPIVVFTDDEGQKELMGLVPDLELINKEAELGTRVAKFIGVPLISQSPKNLAVYSLKAEVMMEALERHESTLYLDSDMLVLRPYYDVLDVPMALTPELPGLGIARDGLHWGHSSSGYWNAGCIYLHRGGRHLCKAWIKDFYAIWPKYNNVTDSEAHGCFCDQSSLELMPLMDDIGSLHLGHNVFAPRIAPFGANVSDPYSLRMASNMTAGNGLYFRGWPVVSIHCHFYAPNYHAHGPGFFRQMLGHCQDTFTRQIAAIL